jgi:hypothetical protein
MRKGDHKRSRVTSHTIFDSVSDYVLRSVISGHCCPPMLGMYAHLHMVRNSHRLLVAARY